MYLKYLVALLVIIAVSSCDGKSSDSAASDDAQSSLLSDIKSEMWPSMFVTLDAENSIDGKWFCSFYSQEKYISRSALELYMDNTGFIDRKAITWNATKTGELVLSSTGWIFEISNVVFSNRNAIDDHFEGTIGDEANISCDWGGTPKQALVVLSDASEPGDLFLDEDRDPELEGRLLTTLNDGIVKASWTCEMSQDSAIVDYSSYEFYVGNNGFSIFELRWFPVSEDSVLIDYQDVRYQLENIRFTDNNYNRFLADDSRGYKLACDWVGEGRG